MTPLYRAVACDSESMTILDRDILVRALDLDEALTALACQCALSGGRPSVCGNRVDCGQVCYLVVPSHAYEGIQC